MSRLDQRYEAAEAQGWQCSVCGGPMVDWRECARPLQDGGRVCGVPHPDIEEQMPRFHPSKYGAPNVHAGTLRIGDNITAAHQSCVKSHKARLVWKKRNSKAVPLPQFMVARAADARRGDEELRASLSRAPGLELIWVRSAELRDAEERIIQPATMVLQSWDAVQSGRPEQAPFLDVTRREKSHAYATLADLAVTYSHHPDYDESWRP